ncbi:MAG TPA: hypothetical protein VNC41_11550, partial [Acidimicrobiia bacterium]|nr:hypothetical protein [Acidimicrobiia bacterium]
MPVRVAVREVGVRLVLIVGVRGLRLEGEVRAVHEVAVVHPGDFTDTRVDQRDVDTLTEEAVAVVRLGA